MIETELAPGLLCAMPQLEDRNFARSVVLMLEHSAKGSMGLIINQPSELLASELLENLEMPWNGPKSMVVWAGGPVNPNTGWVLHEPQPMLKEVRGAVEVIPGVELSVSVERLRTLAAAPPRRMRVLLGYAGWGPGQLADEIAEGSWLHASADPRLIFETPANEMWDAAVRSLGISPARVVSAQGVN